MMTLQSTPRSRMRCASSSPVSFVISMSVTTMSGLSRSISVHASSPFAALPITSRSDSSRSNADNAPRTIAWSSASTTRIMVRSGRSWCEGADDASGCQSGKTVAGNGNPVAGMQGHHLATCDLLSGYRLPATGYRLPSRLPQLCAYGHGRLLGQRQARDQHGPASAPGVDAQFRADAGEPLAHPGQSVARHDRAAAAVVLDPQDELRVFGLQRHAGAVGVGVALDVRRG